MPALHIVDYDGVVPAPILDARLTNITNPDGNRDQAYGSPTRRVLERINDPEHFDAQPLISRRESKGATNDGSRETRCPRRVRPPGPGIIRVARHDPQTHHA
jgi:hypothetical protein